MSDEPTISVSRENQLLGMMADQQQELSTFRKNTHERLAQLERAPRRSSMSRFLDMDFDSIVSMMWIAVGILIFSRIVIYLLAQAKLKGEGHAHVSLP